MQAAANESNTSINANEMFNIIKEAIKNKKPVYYRGLFVSKEDSHGPIQKMTLNKNNMSFRFFYLKDDEITKKIEETVAPLKLSKESSSSDKIWHLFEQEKKYAFDDLWLLIKNKILKEKSFAVQILIENDLYIINFNIFKELYKIMNEKSINYIFNDEICQIEDYNSLLNLNGKSTFDTSFMLLHFPIIVEKKEKDKKLEYLLIVFTSIDCSNKRVIEINDSTIFGVMASDK